MHLNELIDRHRALDAKRTGRLTVFMWVFAALMVAVFAGPALTGRHGGSCRVPSHVGDRDVRDADLALLRCLDQAVPERVVGLVIWTQQLLALGASTGDQGAT